MAIDVATHRHSVIPGQYDQPRTEHFNQFYQAVKTQMNIPI